MKPNLKTKLTQRRGGAEKQWSGSRLSSCLLCASAPLREIIAGWRPRRGFPRLTLALAAGLVLIAASLAWACNVPVFRFALERWRPDPYRAVIFHRGPLTDADRGLIQPLVEQQDAGTANLSLRTVDVSQLDV